MKIHVAVSWVMTQYSDVVPSGSQGIIRLLWNPESHYNDHSSRWTLAWARQIQPELKYIFYIILPSTTRSPKWPLHFRFSKHSSVCMSQLYVPSIWTYLIWSH